MRNVQLSLRELIDNTEERCEKDGCLREHPSFFEKNAEIKNYLCKTIDREEEYDII